jgi:hypothetical protein
MDGASKARATLLVGSANDLHPQPTYTTGGPYNRPGSNNHALQIRSSHTVLTDNQWAQLPIHSVKSQLARLVANGAVVVNDGAVNLTPDQISGMTEAGVPSVVIHQELTNQAADTYEYPSASGFDSDGYKNFALQYKLDDATLQVFGRNHADLDWQNITHVAYDSGSDTYGNTIIGAAGTAVNGTLHFDDIDLRYVYAEVVTTDGGNTIELNGRLS